MKINRTFSEDELPPDVRNVLPSALAGGLVMFNGRGDGRRTYHLDKVLAEVLWANRDQSRKTNTVPLEQPRDSSATAVCIEARRFYGRANEMRPPWRAPAPFTRVSSPTLASNILHETILRLNYWILLC